MTIPIDSRSGEWECDYPDWKRLWTAAELLIETVPVATWTEAMSEDIFYALARDNECEFIADEIGARSETLLVIAARAVDSVDANVKWQIAAKLGELSEHISEAETLLIRFMQDSDEYVRRRTLIALAKLNSEKTEMFAEQAWQTGHEYQRIAALWALKDTGSPKLADYLQKAEEDGRKYIVRNATEIRAG